MASFYGYCYFYDNGQRLNKEQTGQAGQVGQAGQAMLGCEIDRALVMKTLPFLYIDQFFRFFRNNADNDNDDDDNTPYLLLERGQ